METPVNLVTTLSVTPAEIALLDSLAFVATEHESSLDLTAFANLIDLYAHYSATASGADLDTRLAFEEFVRDGAALRLAAETAERASGIPTAAPLPLAA